MRSFRCNLHMHTCLSPCAGMDMTPRRIVRECEGLDIIAITDHNSSENVIPVMEAARGRSLLVIPGMEVCSREEVHTVALFDSTDHLEGFQSFVYEHLDGLNDERSFGTQAIVDEGGKILTFNPRLLIGATDLPLERVVAAIHEFCGLAIAAHIDRQSYSVISQLGFVPAGIDFDALEISYRTRIEDAVFPGTEGLPVITSSDAHFPGDIMRASTSMLLERAEFAEIRMAFEKKGGRMIQGGNNA